MVAVIILAFCYWACSGVVASVKAARTKAKATAMETLEGAADANAATPEAADTPHDITFGQWQRAFYTRTRNRVRSAIPGQHLGKRASDLIGDISAATIAGTALFGFGFASGLTWAGTRIAHQAATRRARPDTGAAPRPDSFSSRPRSSSGRWRRPGKPFAARPGVPGPGLRPPRRSTRPQNPGLRAGGGVVDVELIGAPTTPQNTGLFAGAEDADIVPDNPRPIGAISPTPHAPDHTAAPNGHPMEILTIHHLFVWARNVVAHTVNAVDRALVRSRSAAERSASALARSNSAVARAESAAIAAAAARGYAVQLEETGARFRLLRMDSASMTSMGVAITAAINHGQLAQRRAEAEAIVATKAAELAIAEEVAAVAAAAEAAGAQAWAEAVQLMHDTVQARQMPHAIAQAATGNAAAHSSLLAGG